LAPKDKIKRLIYTWLKPRRMRKNLMAKCSKIDFDTRAKVMWFNRASSEQIEKARSEKYTAASVEAPLLKVSGCIKSFVANENKEFSVKDTLGL
jgi:hypothetical protein